MEGLDLRGKGVYFLLLTGMVLPYMGYTGICYSSADLLFTSLALETGNKNSPNNSCSFLIKLRCENYTPLVILSLSQPQRQDSYFYNNYCQEQGHKFISFCLKQVQSLRDSASHPHSKFKGVPPCYYAHKRSISLV